MSFNPALSYSQGFQSAQKTRERERENELQKIIETVSGDNDPMKNDLFSKLPINVQNGFRQAATLKAGLDEKQQATRYNAMIKDFRLAKGLNEAGYVDEAVSLLRDRAANSETPENTNRVLSAFQQGGSQGMGEMLSIFDEAVSGAAGSKTYKPEISTPQVDPDTGQQYVIITDPNTQQARRENVKGGKVETGDDKMDRDIRKELLKQSITESGLAFESLKQVRSNISTYDDAIKALDNGANTGVIEQYLPSFQKSTIELENAAQRLGLDVISATTFGALSEGELRLAMSTAVPMGLEPDDLKDWLKKKKASQQKLGKEMREMAITLGRGKMTISEYLDKNNYSTATNNKAAAESNVIDWNDL